MTLRRARDWVYAAERRFADAELFYGHGTTAARDEAAFLVLHALGLPFDCTDEALDRELADDEVAAIATLIDRRIETRTPAAYLTRKMWFAGLEFYVDERVLVPRSPLAEVIADELRPWLEPTRVKRVLEIGTGSGCIAIAMAEQFPHAEIVATDISTDAIDVAAINIDRYPALGSRIRLEHCDLFPAGAETFDVIISNPPYVPSAVVEGLPDEYHHEPRLALDAGADGLDVLRRLIAEAPRRLMGGGALFLDVGEMSAVVDDVFGDVAFTWIDLVFGGEGVGLAYKADFKR